MEVAEVHVRLIKINELKKSCDAAKINYIITIIVVTDVSSYSYHNHCSNKHVLNNTKFLKLHNYLWSTYKHNLNYL
jgi:hypothetical protein